jgi:23S rRNA (cytidine1920-2'-O)/16S rRNA (cytidine1409-2'-O)-methyltransferase
MNSRKSTKVSGRDSSTKVAKQRLDLLLVERGVAASRQRARALLLAGQVRVSGIPMDKPGTLVPVDAQIQTTGEQVRYASRGGLKLEGALADFGVSPQDQVCLDVGSSNGGFTDCLLQNGARRVYAVDVTIDQLDWKLRRDSRVTTIEGNARYLRPDELAEAAELVTVDVSFISLSKILPAIVQAAASGANFLILIKPQFELDKRDIGKGGIVREPELHKKAIDRVVSAASSLGLEVVGVLPSRLTGAGGNQEFFLHAKLGL